MKAILKRINSIRPQTVFPSAAAVKKQILIVVLLGGVVGIAAKYADTVPNEIVPGLSGIARTFGFWAFSTSIIAVFSPSPRIAGVKSFCYLASMTTVYYICQQILENNFGIPHFFFWLLISAFGMVGGVCVWYSRGLGWISAIISTIPVLFCLSEGIRFSLIIDQYLFLVILNAIESLILLIIIPANNLQRLKMLAITIAAFVLINRNVLYALLFAGNY